jgi:hypothetical protein
LSDEIRIDPVAGLVSGPELIAERFDDVIGGDANVANAAVDQAKD